jgi:hypothetical protein
VVVVVGGGGARARARAAKGAAMAGPVRWLGAAGGRACQQKRSERRAIGERGARQAGTATRVARSTAQPTIERACITSEKVFLRRSSWCTECICASTAATKIMKKASAWHSIA